MNEAAWDAERWTEVSTLFHRLLELPLPERETALAQTQITAPQVALAVRRMLEADAAFSTDTPPSAAAWLAEAVDPVLPPGARLGAYAVESCLGAGGMGRVYRARRVDGDVSQSVAIKCLRFPGRDADFAATFLRERRILARLNHPHIARFLDMGTDAAGRPFIVMEYVDGVPLVTFASARALPLRARLELLLQVMQAVAYSHRQLVVHRDIKPGNVLVDADGATHLLDFGIAKLLAPDDAPVTDGDTVLQQRAFSIAYAAPEQLGAGVVGTACDIYALGAVAYELACGRAPFTMDGLSYAEAERCVREVFPAPPSERLADAAKAPDGGDVAGWRRALRGDLDNIILQALKKEPSARYATVDAFADDLRRYLDNQPISLRSGHGRYRAMKFIQRNTVTVTIALALAIALIGGVAAVTWQARIAQRRAAELEQVAAFQAKMLGQVDPVQAGSLLGKDIAGKLEQALVKAGLPETERTAQTQAFGAQWHRISATDVARDLIERAVLKPAVEAIDQQFKEQPLVDAALRQVLADRYARMGLYDAAMSLQERALATRREHLGNRHPDTLTSVNGMGEVLHLLGRTKEAEAYVREALEQRRRVLGEEHPDTLASIDHIGTVLLALGRGEEAEPFYRDALEKRRRVLGVKHAETLSSASNLAVLLWEQGRLDEVEPYLLDVLDARHREFGEDDWRTLLSLHNMGALRRDQGKFADAESFLLRALDGRRRVLGADHPETLVTLNMLGNVMADLKRPDAAVQYYTEALQAKRRMLGDQHPETAMSLSNLSGILRKQGKLDVAESYSREALQTYRLTMGDDAPHTLVASVNLANVLLAQNRNAEVLALLDPIEGVARRVFTGANRNRLAKQLMLAGAARAGLKEFSAAAAKLNESHALYLQVPGPSVEGLRNCTMALVDLYTAWQAAEPGKGHDATAAEWRRKLADLEAGGLPPAPAGGA